MDCQITLSLLENKMRCCDDYYQLTNLLELQYFLTSFTTAIATVYN